MSFVLKASSSQAQKDLVTSKCFPLLYFMHLSQYYFRLTGVVSVHKKRLQKRGKRKNKTCNALETKRKTND